jgi:hypothetical protein
MVSEGIVRGAVLVQSYDADERYGEEDRALLAYVASTSSPRSTASRRSSNSNIAWPIARTNCPGGGRTARADQRNANGPNSS